MSEMLHFGRRPYGEWMQAGQGFRRHGMVIRSDREGTASFVAGGGLVLPVAGTAQEALAALPSRQRGPLWVLSAALRVRRREARMREQAQGLGQGLGMMS